MDEIEKLKEKEKYQLLEMLIFSNGTRLMCIKQKNENYFIHSYQADGLPYKEFLEEFSEPELKEVLKKINPDRYIEFGFNDVEEA